MPLSRKITYPLVRYAFWERIKGSRHAKGPHKPKTRRHLAYATPRDWLGRRGKPILVNTGRNYRLASRQGL